MWPRVVLGWLSQHHYLGSAHYSREAALSTPTSAYAMSVDVIRQCPVSYNPDKQRRLPPVLFLPTETLETICLYCAFDHDDSDNKHAPTPSMPTWVNVSYVCRHWRNVALNFPTLWASISAGSPRWTEVLLTRSKQAPLKVNVEVDRLDRIPSMLRCTEQVLEHADRIQEFHFSLPSPLFHDVYGALRGHPSSAPLLQTLVVSVGTTPMEWHPVWPLLFDGHTPALRTLKLVRCPIPWHSFMLSSLTTLDLYCIPSQLQQSTANFLATLRCMRDLKYLYLDEVLASATDFLPTPAFQSFDKIQLPHLARLLIAAPLSTVITLLSCLAIPLKTQVQLFWFPEYDVFLGDLTFLLAQRLSTLQDQALSNSPIRLLHIKFQGKQINPVMVSAGTRQDAHGHLRTQLFPHWKWDNKVPLQVGFCIEQGILTEHDDTVVSDVCCAAPLHHVESAYVANPPLSSTFWHRLLGRLPNLRRLQLSDGYMPDLASALSLSSQDRAANMGEAYNQGPEDVLAPALTTLVLANIEFAPLGETPTASPAGAMQTLFDALASRKDSRGQVILRSCVLPSTPPMIPTGDIVVGRWEGGVFQPLEYMWG